MKLLVETTGDFMFQLAPGVEIPSHRPAVVDKSYFVASRLGSGELGQIAQLNDEATDEEFQKYWDESKTDEDPMKNDAEKQRDLAVESFKSKFEEAPKKDQADPQVDTLNVNEPDEFQKRNQPKRTAHVTTGKPKNEPEQVN